MSGVNLYLDTLIELVDHDGSFEARGRDPELAATVAIALELHLIRLALEEREPLEI